MTGAPWHQAPLVALDLEGSGAQDRDEEVVLGTAAVPITNGQRDCGDADCTLVNPGRTIPIGPGLRPG